MSATIRLAPADTAAGDRAGPAAPAARRLRLRELDDCLGLLEDAHEEDESLVSASVSARIGRRMPGIVPGMLITEALELVFQEQEQFLAAEDDLGWVAGPRRSADGATPTAEPAPLLEPRQSDPEPGAPTLDESSARALTDRIKASATEFSLLLLEAHEGRAWSVLGYRSWEHYVRSELGLSRTRSYELLDHGRLIRSIHSITGAMRLPDIPPYAARVVKPHMAEFVAALAEQVLGKSAEEVPGLIDGLLRDHRPRPAATPVRAGSERGWSGCEPEAVAEAARIVQAAASQGWPEQLDVALLWAAVDCLAAMPPVPGVVQRAAGETGQRLAGLEFAIEWLVEFTDAWRELLHPAKMAGRAPTSRTLALLGLERPPSTAAVGSRRAGRSASRDLLPRRAAG